VTPALVFDDARLVFTSGRGVRDLTATVGAGEVIALVGPSGSGKSTLLRLAAGELGAQHGSVHTLGQPLAALPTGAYRAARARVGVLEQADNLTPGLSVLHNVLAGRLGQWPTWLALRNRVWPRPADVDEARGCLAAVELAERLHDDPAELSGGERQRVALARLAFQGAQLWLADEPTAGLDVRLRAQTMEHLITVVRQAKATAVVALHDLELLDCDFDQVWGLRDGVLAFAGPPGTFDADARAALYEGRT
jgi:phosphonate transport system ATP-binding protein